MTHQQSMLVAACARDGSIRLENRPLPIPAEGEILLRLAACGLCGTDLFKYNYATEEEGTVLGHEIVGTVEVSHNQRFAPGERIVVPHHVSCGDCPLCQRGADTQCPTFKENLFFPGGFAEFVVIRERAVRRAAHRIPEHITTAAASFLEPAACVLRGIDKAELSAGGCVLILGGGTMGLLHLHVLRAIDDDLTILISDPIAERRQFAADNGAIALPADADAIQSAVREHSAGLGADAVFDTVGGARLTELGLHAIRPGGTVVLFAHAADGERADFPLNPFFKTEARLLATYSGSLSEQRRIADVLFSGRLDPSPLVSHRLPLNQIAEAVALARRAEAYKILLGPQ